MHCSRNASGGHSKSFAKELGNLGGQSDLGVPLGDGFEEQFLIDIGQRVGLFAAHGEVGRKADMGMQELLASLTAGIT